jgi:outer membrane protein assembly factor BamA
MTKQATLIAALLLCSFPSLAQKKLPPRSIRFQGAPQYTQQELLAAAGLKPDSRLSPNQVKASAKLLSDTGLFAVVKFANDSKGLLFSLTPSSQFFPMHLDNLPLKPGKELDDQLHQRFPLYHGQLPATGSMVEGIRKSFEDMLTVQGIKATVKAALTSGLGTQKITAVDFTVTEPSVRIGAIQLSGVSPAMQAKAGSVVSSQSGNAYDTENSGPGLQRTFEDAYQDQGYAAVHVEVAQIDPPKVDNQGLEVPFSVTIREGDIYKLGAINYPADALVPRAEVARILSKFQNGSGRPLDLFALATRDAYHSRGYLDCSVAPHPSFNEATHIANYSLEITPGPIYKMGAVQFDGAPDAMNAKLTHLWTMAHGQDFNEGYVSSFAALAEKKDKALSKWMQTVVTTYDVKPDPATHQVNCVFHFAKAAQSAH